MRSGKKRRPKKRTAAAAKSFAGTTYNGGIERSVKKSFSKTGGAGQHPHETSTPQFNRMKYTNTGTKLSADMQGNKSNYPQNKHIQRSKKQVRKVRRPCQYCVSAGW